MGEHLCSLTQRTEDPQVKVRRAAIQALGRAAPAGVPRICAFFHDKDDSIRHFAAETLGANGNEAAATACAQLLHGTSGTVKCASLLALGRMKLTEWSPQVASCLHDKDLQTRLAAIQALSDLGAESHAEELEALADDESKGVRQAAVACLAKMGNAGARAACRFLEDQDPAVRQSAVRVYSPLHSKLKATLARPYADVVARRLLDEDWRVRLAAVVALGDLNTREFVEQIGALHHDSDLQVRRSVWEAQPFAGSHFGVYFENVVSDAYVFATAMGRGKIGMGRGKGGTMGKGKGAGNPEIKELQKVISEQSRRIEELEGSEQVLKMDFEKRRIHLQKKADEAEKKAEALQQRIWVLDSRRRCKVRGEKELRPLIEKLDASAKTAQAKFGEICSER
eukprot:symbB.v1.2.009180.t1/scaffold575.1/size184962/1